MGLCGSTANQDDGPSKAVPKDDKPTKAGETEQQKAGAGEAGSSAESIRGSASLGTGGVDVEGKHHDETEPQTPQSPIDTSEITLSPGNVVTLGEHLHAQKVKVKDGSDVVEELRAIELQSPKPKTPGRRTSSSQPKQKLDAAPPAPA